MALTQIDDRGLKTPIDLIDNEKIRLGTGNDLELWHQTSNSYITSTGANLTLRAVGHLYLQDIDGNTMADFNDGGSVELYDNGTKKFETTSAGVNVTGVLQCDEFKLLDGEHAKFGTGEDLRIYHTGSLSYIQDTGTGHLVLSGTKVQMTNAADSEGMFMATEDGSVDLYYDGTKKFETSSAGTTTTGNATFTGHIYQGDNDAHFLGDGSDLQIFHDGSNSYIDNSTGELQIRTAYLRIRAKDDGEDIATFNDDAGVELFYDNTLRAATTANGFQAFGNLTIRDNVIFYIGDGNDLKIYHDGSNTYLDNATGDVYLRQNGTENSAKFIKNGGVELYYNDAKKMETLSNGVGFDGDSSACALRLKSDGSIRGYFYADANSSTGHLNNSGAWKFRVEDDGDYQFYGSSISDRDKKDNIATVTGTSLDKITKLVPKTYNWKNLDGITPTDKTFTGFIAQEVKEHLPSLVTGTDGQKNMAVDYNGILAYAVKAITELSAEVETLKTKVAALEAA